MLWIFSLCDHFRPYLSQYLSGFDEMSTVGPHLYNVANFIKIQQLFPEMTQEDLDSDKDKVCTICLEHFTLEEKIFKL